MNPLSYLRQYADDFASLIYERTRFLRRKCEKADVDDFVGALLFLITSAILTAVLEITPKDADSRSGWIYFWISFRSHVAPNLLFVLSQTMIMSLVSFSVDVGWRKFFIAHAYVYGALIVARSVILLWSGGDYGSDFAYGITSFVLAMILIFLLMASVAPRGAKGGVFGVLMLVSICVSVFLASGIERAMDEQGDYQRHFGRAVDHAGAWLVRLVPSSEDTDREAMLTSEEEVGLEQPVTLIPGVSQSGALELSDEIMDGKFRDTYDFSGRSGQVVDLRVTSLAFDTYVVLRSPSGDNLEEDDDGGGSRNSRIEESLEESGRYEVIVTSYAVRETGRYDVTLSMTPAPEPVASDPVSVSVGDEVDALEPYAAVRDCLFCPELVVLPEGTFFMGTRRGEEEGHAREEPRHRVQVEGFAIGRYEVQVSEYASFIAGTGHVPSGGCWTVEGESTWGHRPLASWAAPGFEQDALHPAACVSWLDAQEYVAWLSRTTGNDYRLPTEAEWEYAARAGTTTRRYWGDGARSQCVYANGADHAKRRRYGGTVADCDDGVVATAEVGRFRPNRFGLYDMLGNVWEWVADCWHDNYEGAPSDGSAWMNDSDGQCESGVLRGGDWGGHPFFTRAASRVTTGVATRSGYGGFRVARTVP